MYMIGYTDPITGKDSEIKITTEFIDFNTYKPEHIYYIDKRTKDKTKHNMSLYVSYLAQGGIYDAENYIGNYTSLPNMYEPLTLYDKMLIWMFNNPAREQYDKELKTEYFKKQGKNK